MKSKNYPILNFNSLQMYNKNGNIGTPVPDKIISNYPVCYG